MITPLLIRLKIPRTEISHLALLLFTEDGILDFLVEMELRVCQA